MGHGGEAIRSLYGILSIRRRLVYCVLHIVSRLERVHSRRIRFYGGHIPSDGLCIYDPCPASIVGEGKRKGVPDSWRHDKERNWEQIASTAFFTRGHRSTDPIHRVANRRIARCTRGIVLRTG